MKQIALLLFALTAWGQSPPTTTVADTIYTGLNNGTISGRLQITSPERTYNGQTLILPPQSIPIVNGAFSVTLVPNDITMPASTYTVEVYASYSPRPIMVYSWYVTTSVSTLKLSDVIQRRTVAPPDFPMLSLFQISIGGAGIDDCIGNDGVKAVWKTCGTGGGGSASWGGLSGSPTDNSALVALLAGKASTTHATTHASAGTDALTLDLSQISGLISSLAGKVDGLSSVTDGQLLQFNGTGGKTVKASTLTGVLKASSGVPAVVTGTSTDCVRVNGTSGTCGAYTAGAGVTIVTDTLAIDTSAVPRYSSAAGTVSYTTTAGSETRWNTSTNFWYVANGTSSWDVVYKAGTTIMAADLPAPTTTALGGVKRNVGTTGQFVNGVDSSGNLTYDTPAGGTGAVDSVNSAVGAVTLTTGTSGTAPAWSGTALNIPSAGTASVTAGTISKTEYDTFNGKQDSIAPYTVGTLPPTPATNMLAIVTDASVAGSCNSGGGSALSLCRYNGSSWASVGDGGTGGGSTLGPLLTSNSPGSSLAQGATYYVKPGSTAWGTERPWYSPYACSLKDMYVTMYSAITAGQTVVVTVRTDYVTPGTLADTTLTCTVNDSSTPVNRVACSDTTHTTSISKGSQVSIKAVASATSGPIYPTVSIACTN